MLRILNRIWRKNPYNQVRSLRGIIAKLDKKLQNAKKFGVAAQVTKQNLRHMTAERDALKGQVKLLGHIPVQIPK